MQSSALMLAQSNRSHMHATIVKYEMHSAYASRLPGIKRYGSFNDENIRRRSEIQDQFYPLCAAYDARVLRRIPRMSTHRSFYGIISGRHTSILLFANVFALTEYRCNNWVVHLTYPPVLLSHSISRQKILVRIFGTSWDVLYGSNTQKRGARLINWNNWK